MLESRIEKTFTARVRNLGGLCMKFVSPGLDGVPDRLVLMPRGRACFVEFKAPGRKPRPLQVLRGRQLESYGFPVYVISEMSEIGGVLRAICAP